MNLSPEIKRILRYDLKFIQSLVDDFLCDQVIRNRLTMIKGHDVNDWEKWLQVELEYYLRTTNKVKNIKREVPYIVDRRRSKLRNKIYLDFTFNKRINSTEVFMVELKRERKASTLLRNMWDDVVKIYTMRGSCDNCRTFWCIGFYSDVGVKSNLLIEKKLNEYETPTVHKIVDLDGKGLQMGYIIL
ncbi:hypothetical protein [Serratia fonticola]|uniref:hypothetical protein n=1 Tax=Serratia fonticola TaxID=47917 RepID=UPI0034C5C166